MVSNMYAVDRDTVDRLILLHLSCWLTKPPRETEAVSFSTIRQFPLAFEPKVKQFAKCSRCSVRTQPLSAKFKKIGGAEPNFENIKRVRVSSSAVVRCPHNGLVAIPIVHESVDTDE